MAPMYVPCSILCAYGFFWLLFLFFYILFLPNVFLFANVIFLCEWQFFCTVKSRPLFFRNSKASNTFISAQKQFRLPFFILSLFFFALHNMYFLNIIFVFFYFIFLWSFFFPFWMVAVSVVGTHFLFWSHFSSFQFSNRPTQKKKTAEWFFFGEPPKWLI